MSASIPFEIQEEIMKRAPVKSLIRFRTLSKQWKSLIDSSEFITDHSLNQTQPHHLLVSYLLESRVVLYERKYVSIVDDDSFPQHNLSPTFTPAINLVYSRIIGCSHGLVCLLCDNQDLDRKFIVWNPSIRKSVAIVFPRLPFTKLGFGVYPKTSDPKIVKITGKTFMNLKAEVFRLSSGAWRSVSMNLSYYSIKQLFSQVVVDGAIYWFALVKTTKDGPDSIKLLSFDLTSEEFIQRDLPDKLAQDVYHRYGYEGLSKLKESLVVLNYFIYDDQRLGCEVWMMLKNNVPNPSFTKLYNVKLNEYGFYKIIGFRKTGQPIMEQGYGYSDGSMAIQLGVYEFSSKQINNLETYTSHIDTAFYTESLLLLNHTGSLS